MKSAGGKKIWIVILTPGISLGGFAGTTQAQSSYPVKPVSIIVPSAAGGAGDTTIRIIAEEAEKGLGQKILVVHRPGAGSVESGLLQAMVLSDGNPAIFVTRPLSAISLCLTLAALIVPPPLLRRRAGQDSGGPGGSS
jgi:tripartite-type tricarboxylate transporter receptor subunit TctC